MQILTFQCSSSIIIIYKYLIILVIVRVYKVFFNFKKWNVTGTVGKFHVPLKKIKIMENKENIFKRKLKNLDEVRLGGYTASEYIEMIQNSVLAEPSAEVLEFISNSGEGKTEGRIQSECITWFKNTFPLLRGLLYHVPNGGAKDKKEAGQLFAMGVVAGVPDLQFHFWRRTFFLECKTPTGTVSDDQKDFHAKTDQHGFRTFVFRSLNEFQKIIWAIIEDRSLQFARGMTRKDFEYRNGIFQYIYDLEVGVVQMLSDVVTEENQDKFKGYVFEFMTDCLDKIEGFEILFTPDYLGFYKKDLEGKKAIHYEGFTAINLPNERK